jgi:hypothetical protein
VSAITSANDRSGRFVEKQRRISMALVRALMAFDRSSKIRNLVPNFRISAKAQASQKFQQGWRRIAQRGEGRECSRQEAAQARGVTQVPDRNT